MIVEYRSYLPDITSTIIVAIESYFILRRDAISGREDEISPSATRDAEMARRTDGERRSGR